MKDSADQHPLIGPDDDRRRLELAVEILRARADFLESCTYVMTAGHLRATADDIDIVLNGRGNGKSSG